MGAHSRRALLALVPFLAACGKERPPGIVSLDSGFLGDRGVVSQDRSPPPELLSPDAPDGTLEAAVDGGADAEASVPMDLPADTVVAVDSAPRDTGPMDVPADGPRVESVRPLAPWSGGALRSRRPTFRWAAFAGAARYRVEVASTRAFSPVEYMATEGGTRVTPSEELPAGLRYWRVVPVTATGDGLPGPVWEVTLGHAPADVDGDGDSEVLFSAAGASRVYLSRGGAGMDNTPDVTYAGETRGEYFGQALSAAGDVNNDGFADVLVGAPYNDVGHEDGGRVFLFTGGPTPATRPALQIPGVAANALTGRAVSIVGDVNGDGYADLAVGAPQANSTGPLSGRVLIFYGGATPDADADVTITFAAAGDQLGFSVAGAGDVNGDGYADVVVGAPRNDVGGENSGQAYVFFGGERMDPNVDLSLPGAGAGDTFGAAVAGAGDVNGDGYADVVVGGPNAMGTSTSTGMAVVYYGGATPDATPDLLLRGTAGEKFGFAVAGVGDVNNDGFGDVLVGAPENTVAGMSAGRAYLFLGAAAPTPVAAATFSNSMTGDQLGYAVAGAGDVNRDGFGDFTLGARYAPFSGRSGPGSVYVFFGGSAVMATPRVTFRGTIGDDLGTAVAWRWRSPVHDRRAPGES
jgi:hypothetical protein